jgi:DNA replicative helicase MCM subunit Mcm2 (Cdc46/Mcm family)
VRLAVLMHALAVAATGPSALHMAVCLANVFRIVHQACCTTAGERDGAPKQLTAPAGASGDAPGGSLRHRMQSFVCDNPLPAQLIKCYVSYAKEYCQPVLTTDAKLLLKDFYLELRQQAAMCPTVSVTVRAAQCA